MSFDLKKLFALLLLILWFLGFMTNSCSLDDFDDFVEIPLSQQSTTDLINEQEDEEMSDPENPIAYFESTQDFDSFDFDEYYDSIDHIILAYFEIENGSLGQVILPDIHAEFYHLIEDDAGLSLAELIAFQEELHKANDIWEAVLYLIPEQYLQQIAYFELFTDGIDNDLGAIEETGDGTDLFILSLDIDDMLTREQELDTDLLFDTIIHELAHLITLSSGQVTAIYEEDSDPLTYYIYEYDLDTFADSYMNLFYQAFWDDMHAEWSSFYYTYGITLEGSEDLTGENMEILQQCLDDFYEKYEDRFVTDYAATSPSEDIAETFIFFVLKDKPQTRLIRDQKVLFFYDFDEMMNIRAHVQDYISSLSVS